MTHRDDQILRFIQFMTVSTAIAWLSLMATPPRIQHTFWGWDKAQHALAYGALAWSAGRFFRLWNFGAKRVWGMTWVGVVVFGGLIEVLQSLAGTGRTGDVQDLFADALGALLVCGAGMLFHEREKR